MYIFRDITVNPAQKVWTNNLTDLLILMSKVNHDHEAVSKAMNQISSMEPGDILNFKPYCIVERMKEE